MSNINCSACGAYGAEKHRHGCPIKIATPDERTPNTDPFAELEYSWDFGETTKCDIIRKEISNADQQANPAIDGL